MRTWCGFGMIGLVVAAGVAVLLPAGGAAGAGTKISVPGDYATIQEAIDAAADGDTISVTGGPYAGGNLVSGRNDLTITGKVVTIDAAGAQYCLRAVDCLGLVVSGFAMTDATEGALDLDGCAGAIVTGCEFADCDGDGIRTGNGCTDVTISKCEFRSLRYGLFDTGTSHLVVSGCDIRYATRHAISLSENGNGGGSDDSAITKNVVDDIGLDGIHVMGERIVVEKNTVAWTGGDGIAVDSSSDGSSVTITKNKVDHAGVAGILGFYETTIEKNTVTDSGSNGIESRGPGALVTGNKVSGSGLHGIMVYGPGSMASGNKIAGSFMGGIVWPANFGTVTKNKVSGSGHYGFIVDGTSNTFTGNSAKDSPDYDLWDEGQMGDNVYEKNKFETTHWGDLF
jgi:hypothetical protein